MSSIPDFRERLVWDGGEIRDGEIRYLMIRPDGLMGMFARLSADAREEALEAVCASIAEHGAKSASAYRAMGADGASALLDVIVRTAPQLGWGEWSFAEAGADRLALRVDNSPFAAGSGGADGPMCAPIRGMLTALAGMIFDRPVRVSETDCAACGASSCLFAAEA